MIPLLRRDRRRCTSVRNRVLNCRSQGLHLAEWHTVGFRRRSGSRHNLGHSNTGAIRDRERHRMCHQGSRTDCDRTMDRGDHNNQHLFRTAACRVRRPWSKNQRRRKRGACRWDLRDRNNVHRTYSRWGRHQGAAHTDQHRRTQGAAPARSLRETSMSRVRYPVAKHIDALHTRSGTQCTGYLPNTALNRDRQRGHTFPRADRTDHECRMDPKDRSSRHRYRTNLGLAPE